MTDDPCLRCALPDCDETSPRCAIRRLARSYSAKIKEGRQDEITPAERLAAKEAFKFWNNERLAQASEGIRPFRRAGSPWKPGVAFDPNRPSRDRGWNLRGPA